MKTRKIKAKASFRIDYQTKRGTESSEWVDTWELPRASEAYDQMVEQMAEAIHQSEGWATKWSDDMEEYRVTLRKNAADALSAIGIVRPEEIK